MDRACLGSMCISYPPPYILFIGELFIGEESADGGGPRREFWTILGKEIRHSFFEGKGNRLVLRHDSVALVVSKLL